MLRSHSTAHAVLALASSLTIGSAASAQATLRVEVDAAQLRRQAETGTLWLPLPDGRSLTVIEEQRREALSGSFCWSGRVLWQDSAELFEGDGSVALVVHETAVAGTVRTADAVYSIRSEDQGMLRVEAVDLAGFAPCGTTTAHEVAGSPLHEEGALPSGGTSRGTFGQVGPAVVRPEDTVVDVIVVWTPAAQAIVGGPAAVQALADLSVLETNLAYDRSGVALEMRTVHTTLLDYAESGSMSTDLGRLRSKTDGILDEIHPLRDAFGADGVSMLVSGTNPCGVGYLMAVQPSLTFERSAFNVSSYSCAASNYTLAHEFGHNFGLSHDRANTPNTPSQPYAFGYRTTNGAWRTIMAIFNGARIPYFSNPARSFMGFALGIDPTDPDGAANAVALNVNAPFLSAWRPTVVPDAAATPDPRPRTVPGHAGVLLGNGVGDAPLALVLQDGSLRWLAPWRAGERSRWVPIPKGEVVLGALQVGMTPRFLPVR